MKILVKRCSELDKLL